MEYALAKQLKDAGFPQLSTSFTTTIEGDLTAVPSLSELIEVCGEDVGTLELLLDENRHWCWRAQSRNGLAVGRGEFPTEALARLWLVLHCRRLG
jgi:hypothetical protein